MLEATPELGRQPRFFRDTEVCEYVGREVLPAILSARKPEVRIWTVGCGTGEEACSLAILLFECLEAQSSRPDVHVFATDADADAIGRARGRCGPSRRCAGYRSSR